MICGPFAFSIKFVGFGSSNLPFVGVVHSVVLAFVVVLVNLLVLRLYPLLPFAVPARKIAHLLIVAHRGALAEVSGGR